MMNNRVVHALSLGTMVASLLILGIFLLLFVNLNNWIQEWGHTLSMSVYLQDGISDYKRDKIESFIRGLPGAEIRMFISKERAMEDLKGVLGDQSGFLGQLSHNPLPASYEVAFVPKESHEADLKAARKDLEKLEGVEEVEYTEEWVNSLEDLLKMVKIIGFTMGGLLCLGVLFIVTNTIKLAIYARKDEIEILKLVGATDWFVKSPFLLEGMIQGLLGGSLALLALFLGHFFFSTKKLYLLGLAPLDFVFIPSEYSWIILLTGAALGVAGSLIALDRFFSVP